VKVQYPFAKQVLLADLRALSVSLRLAGAVVPGLVAAPLVGELRVRAAEELDYRHEATAQRLSLRPLPTRRVQRP